MELSQFKDIFAEYEFHINNKVEILFSFDNGHRIKVIEKDAPLSDKELTQLNKAMKEYQERKEHRDQLVQEIVEYAYQLPTELELKNLLLQIENFKGISSTLIIEKISEKSPAFLRNRLYEMLE